MARAMLLITALIVMTVAACGQGGTDEGAWTAEVAVASETLFFDEGPEVYGKAVEEAYVEAAMEMGMADSDIEMIEVEKVVEMEVVLEMEGDELAKVAPSGGDGTEGPAPAAAPAERVIVRTVDASLIVSDVGDAVTALEGLAASLGGWVISASRGSGNFGFVSMRVPADSLDAAMERVRDLAETVESESAQSRDVTDEYVDLGARLRNQLATEEALLELLERAESVEDALEVRRELTWVSEEIERLRGRIELIERTAAYSLINVSLSRAPAEMSVDAGEDLTGAVGQPVRFRASLRPPEDITDFAATWDFGDGSEPVTTYRTAPTPEEGVRVTATVTHVYGDDADSPFIAEVTITGSGEGGLVEGSDVALVSIFDLPRIEVFAGESQRVEAGEELSLSGSFTRPTELSDVEFTWDFGDGTDPAGGRLGAGVTTAAARHSYRDHRPVPYRATLTVSASSEAGPVEASGSVLIKVDEAPGWTVGGWSAADTWRDIIRALSGVGTVLITILFWLGILSPVWLAALGVVIWRRRRMHR